MYQTRRWRIMSGMGNATKRLAVAIVAAAFMFTLGSAIPSGASEGRCRIVSSTTVTETVVGYKGNLSERDVTATTTKCSARFATTITFGQWRWVPPPVIPGPR